MQTAEHLTETALETTLGEILTDAGRVILYDDPHALTGCTVERYEDAGILTSNRGLVLRLADGTEFQITIVQQGQGC